MLWWSRLLLVDLAVQISEQHMVDRIKPYVINYSMLEAPLKHTNLSAFIETDTQQVISFTFGRQLEPSVNIRCHLPIFQ